MEISSNFGIALLLTILAGLFTGVGSAVAFFVRRPKIAYLSLALGFSAGVMVYIAFMEMLSHAVQNIGRVMALSAFFVGMAIIGLIDILVPSVENPHHYDGLEESGGGKKGSPLLRMGILAAVAIAIHNFPEGLAAFVTALADVKLGVFTAVAIAIHNIPEGIVISVPILYATGSRKKAFAYSFLSGLSEPAGAVAGYWLLWPFLSEFFLAFLLALVAGIMVYISLDELLPTAHHYGHGHIVIAGVALGMLVMAAGLLLI